MKTIILFISRSDNVSNLTNDSVSEMTSWKKVALSLCVGLECKLAVFVTYLSRLFRDVQFTNHMMSEQKLNMDAIYKPSIMKTYFFKWKSDFPRFVCSLLTVLVQCIYFRVESVFFSVRCVFPCSHQFHRGRGKVATTESKKAVGTEC